MLIGSGIGMMLIFGEWRILGSLWPVGVALAVAVSIQFASILLRFDAPWPEVSAEYGTTAALGRALYTDYLLPFEVAAVLLLSAIVAALALAKREND